MFPQHFTVLSFYQKKKDIWIYRAQDEEHHYILKCIRSGQSDLHQAILDEYESLCHLSHPGIPSYFGLCENFVLPDRAESVTALCMEECTGIPLLKKASFLSVNDTLSILFSIGEILSFLLQNGILYTDLHPSNILIRELGDHYSVTLLDFTCCYYFLKNPNPSYPLRFSYNLSPDLKGQQMLIQELSLLFHALLSLHNNTREEMNLPFRVCMLLETGNHPEETLSLEDFLRMIKECII
ncbi:MAG: protein kinase [Lachnospiraceae bacterium]|nr:protein kinase [Lachnospiraceae bacterium]